MSEPIRETSGVHKQANSGGERPVLPMHRIAAQRAQIERVRREKAQRASAKRVANQVARWEKVEANRVAQAEAREAERSRSRSDR